MVETNETRDEVILYKKVNRINYRIDYKFKKGHNIDVVATSNEPTSSKIITKEEFELLFAQQSTDIYFTQETVLLYTVPDKPNKVYLKLFNYTRYQNIKNGLYVPAKRKDVLSVVFNLTTHNLLYYEYHKRGRKITKKFRTNQIPTDLGYKISNLRWRSGESSDDENFIEILANALALSVNDIKNFSSSRNIGELNGAALIFILCGKGLDFSSLLKDRCNNISDYNLKTLHKNIKPGMEVNQLLHTVFPFDSVELNILKNNQKYNQLLTKDYFGDLRKIFFSLKIKPSDLIKTEWNINNLIREQKMLSRLVEFGYSFNELKYLDYNELSALGDMVNTFLLVNIKLEKSKAHNIAYHKAELDIIVHYLKQFLLQYGVFVPTNNRFTRKIKGDGWRIDPVHFYRNILQYSNDLVAPYAIIDKNNNSVGMCYFNKLKNDVRLSNNIPTSINEIISHKIRNTKAHDYLDYSIKCNKNKLQDYLNEKLNDHTLKMVVFD